jgi:hypothetical protein
MTFGSVHEKQAKIKCIQQNVMANNAMFQTGNHLKSIIYIQVYASTWRGFVADGGSTVDNTPSGLRVNFSRVLV